MFTSLLCEIFDAPLESVEARWMLPDGTFLSSSSSDGKYDVTTASANTNRNVTSLVITSLSYMDNGTYACEVREAGSTDQWTSTNVDLVLLGEFVSVSLLVRCWL